MILSYVERIFDDLSVLVLVLLIFLGLSFFIVEEYFLIMLVKVLFDKFDGFGSNLLLIMGRLMILFIFG